MKTLKARASKWANPFSLKTLAEKWAKRYDPDYLRSDVANRAWLAGYKAGKKEWNDKPRCPDCKGNMEQVHVIFQNTKAPFMAWACPSSELYSIAKAQKLALECSDSRQEMATLRRSPENHKAKSGEPACPKKDVKK